MSRSTGFRTTVLLFRDGERHTIDGIDKLSVLKRVLALGLAESGLKPCMSWKHPQVIPYGASEHNIHTLSGGVMVESGFAYHTEIKSEGHRSVSPLHATRG